MTDTVIATIPVGDHPWGIAINGGRVYVTNYYEDSVSVIDLATDTVTATIPVGDYPLSIAISDGKAYVANYLDSSVSVIDIATNTVIDTIAVGANAHGIEISGNKAYVTNGRDDSVCGDRHADGHRHRHHHGGSLAPYGIASSEGKVYVANCYDNTVSVIDTATNTVIATVAVGNYPCLRRDDPVGIPIPGCASWMLGLNRCSLIHSGELGYGLGEAFLDSRFSGESSCGGLFN